MRKERYWWRKWVFEKQILRYRKWIYEAELSISQADQEIQRLASKTHGSSQRECEIEKTEREALKVSRKIILKESEAWRPFII